jgi:hypothetical protein
MSTPVSISASGKSYLRQILTVRDYLDYDTFLDEGDRANNIPSPLEPEILTIFRDQGIAPALRKLLERFNGNQADVQLVISKFQLPPGDKIKAKELGAAVLQKPDRSSDLRAALVWVKNSNLSERGKAQLSQILYIRDYLDYDTYLEVGDPDQGVRPPLDPAVVDIYRREGIAPALRSLLDKFNGDQNDVKTAIALFDLPQGDRIKAKEIGFALLKEKSDSTDLRAAFERLEKPSAAPASVVPTPEKAPGSEARWPATVKKEPSPVVIDAGSLNLVSGPKLAAGEASGKPSAATARSYDDQAKAGKAATRIDGIIRQALGESLHGFEGKAILDLLIDPQTGKVTLDNIEVPQEWKAFGGQLSYGRLGVTVMIKKALKDVTFEPALREDRIVRFHFFYYNK